MRTAFLVCVALASCGGRIVPSEAADAIAESAPTRDAVAEDAGPCALENGTPLCDAAGCPGPTPCSFCSPFGDRDLTNFAPFGICIDDDSTIYSNALCPFCPYADDLCVNRADWVCVQRALCDKFLSIAFKGCFYNDGTDYTAAPIATVPCPNVDSACGGACPGCRADEVCTGRSPSHPIGVCAPAKNAQGSDATSCWHHPENVAQGCRDPATACLVFKDADPAAQATADHLGICMPSIRCLGLRAALPGGVDCVDGNGNDL